MLILIKKEDFGYRQIKDIKVSDAQQLFMMPNAGMNIKTLQYVMGYFDVGVTLNVYTYASYDRAVEQVTKILDLHEQRGKHIACKCV